MKSKLTGCLMLAAIVCCLYSCGGETTKESDTETSIVDTSSTAVAQPTSTIVTTAEQLMVVTHKVKDFAKWKMGYEAHDSARLAAGIHKYVLGRHVDDSSMILVAMKIDDLAKAKDFGKSADLKKVMQNLGVVGSPSIRFITATWQDTGMISSGLRSRTDFKIKDWDTWFKSFQEGKQERIDNGIAERVVGHDADDNKSVSVVMAIVDTTKARAYWKSDALKKRREAGGVISEPTRFVFHVVHRY
jgi:hypothetical protein